MALSGNEGVSDTAAHDQLVSDFRQGINEEFSLLPVVNYLKDKLSNPVRLVKDYLDGVEVAAGELVVLENVRFNKGEKPARGAQYRKRPSRTRRTAQRIS